MDNNEDHLLGSGALAAAATFADEGAYRQAVEELRAASEAYYRGDGLLMADAEWDALAASVAATEAEHPEWGPSGLATVAMGTAGGEVAHQVAMLSLAKAHSADEVAAFVTRLGALAGDGSVRLVVEPKLDGVALSARYEAGRLVAVVTRGDGTSGELVTDRVAGGACVGLPVELAEAVDVEVRGECVLDAAQFDTANDARVSAGKPAFVNRRNAVAGMIRADGERPAGSMSFFAYTALGAPGDSHLAQMAWLSGLGVGVAASVTDGLAEVTGRCGPEEVGAALGALGGARDALAVEIDGVVVKADEWSVRDAVGATGSSPRWAVAYKFPAEERTTTVLAIEVTPGRTGNLGVRAELEPVFVGGATVAFATLHHPGEVQRLDVRVGDTVLVKRAGDVIPRIEGVVVDRRRDDAERWVAPERCPRCDGEIDTSSKRWRCVRGRGCGAKELLTYACARDALDIEGMGENLVGQLVDAGLVVELDDIYALDVEQLAGLDRMGEVSAAKVVANISAAKDRPLARQLVALGIRMTGRSICRRLAAAFGDLGALRAASVEELAAVDGVGPVRAAVIRAELDEMSELLDRLVVAGVSFDAGGGGEKVLAGWTVVVSGAAGPALGNRSRNEVHEWLESLGAKASSSVSKKTTYVVTDEAGSSKVRKAQALGVPVVSCQAFAELVEQRVRP